MPFVQYGTREQGGEQKEKKKKSNLYRSIGENLLKTSSN